MARTYEKKAFTPECVPEILKGTAFMEEAGADTFEISDLPFVPSGVLAHVLRSDDVAIAVDGTYTNGKAVVTLDADCYHVAGRLSVAIYITDASMNSQCVYACVGNVYRTVGDTELDSGTEVPTLAQLEAAYQACISATQQATNAVSYVEQTGKTDAQKAQARTNIGAASDADVTDLKGAVTEITEPSPEFEPLTPIRTETGKYVFNNTYNDKLNEVVDSSFGYAVFEVEAGKTYRIYGFGYDNYQFYMAVEGDNSNIMDGSSYASNFIENVECGTSEYPSGYTYHTVDKVFTTSGYLFVNYKIEQATGTCSIHTLQPIENSETTKKINNLYNAVDVHGLMKDGNDYYHFTQSGDGYLVRKFKRMGNNNLFQWAGIMRGTIADDELTITETIISYDTDIIGPISIFNTTLWPGQYGEWSGGNHAKVINGVSYPTAEQDSFKCTVNGKEIVSDGLYYGDVKFIAVNNLYFPQSITGADLTTATIAFTETREYNCDTQIHVRVTLETITEGRVYLYYGMQGVIANYDTILFVNNKTQKTLPSNENINFTTKEHEIIATASDGLRLIARLNEVGIGSFSENDGSNGFATLPTASNTRKLYYRLIDGASSHGYSANTVLTWTGDYIVDYV